jgi:large subunit ribosomal protein L5
LIEEETIAAFKLREKNSCGNLCYITWRTDVYAFGPLIHLALPRIHDFKELVLKALMGGNYSLGLEEQLMFPEIDYDKIDQIRGMDVSIITTAK